MTQKEFEERTGRRLDAGDYALVETLYMAAGDMDKDQFCDDLLRMEDPDEDGRPFLPRTLKEVARHIRRTEEEQAELARAFREIKREAAELIVGKACAYDDKELHNMAVYLMGRNETVLTKLRRQLPLSDGDRDYIIARLDGEG